MQVPSPLNSNIPSFRSVQVLKLAYIAHRQVSRPILIQQKVDCHRKTAIMVFSKKFPMFVL